MRKESFCRKFTFRVQHHHGSSMVCLHLVDLDLGCPGNGGLQQQIWLIFMGYVRLLHRRPAPRPLLGLLQQIRHEDQGAHPCHRIFDGGARRSGAGVGGAARDSLFNINSMTRLMKGLKFPSFSVTCMFKLEAKRTTSH